MVVFLHHGKCERPSSLPWMIRITFINTITMGGRRILFGERPLKLVSCHESRKPRMTPRRTMHSAMRRGMARPAIYHARRRRGRCELLMSGVLGIWGRLIGVKSNIISKKSYEIIHSAKCIILIHTHVGPESLL